MTADGPKHPYQVYPVDPRLRAAAAHTGDDWKTLVREKRPIEGVPKREIGPVASGNKVIAVRAVLDEHRKSFSKLIGVEMEAGGVAGAAHHAASKPGFLMIRGVSDLADEHKDAGATQNWRAYACDVAAAYTVGFLRSGPIPFMRDTSAAAVSVIAVSAETTPKAPINSATVAREPLSDSTAVSMLVSGDPEEAYRAVEFLRLRTDCGDRLLSIHASHVTLHAIRQILAVWPEASAGMILGAIKQTGVTGDTWHRARRAADATSPALRLFLESKVVSLVDRTVEVSRHAISALGNLGIAMLYQGELVRAVEEQPEKRLNYALDAAVRSFELASNDTLRQFAADLLVTVASIYESHRYMSLALPTVFLDLAHVDVILSRLLTNGPPQLRLAALDWLGYIGAGRAASVVLSLMAQADDTFKKCAAANIWRMGDTAIVEEMRRLYSEDIALDGVEFGLAYVEDPADFDRLLPHALKRSDFLAIRAIGLRGRQDHVPLLRQQLKSGDPVVRGSASLALARLGERRDLRRSYQEASDVRERTLMALALLEANITDYATVERTLRLDLAKLSTQLIVELQADVVNVLGRGGEPGARTLAKAWQPFYSRGARKLIEDSEPDA